MFDEFYFWFLGLLWYNKVINGFGNNKGKIRNKFLLFSNRMYLRF